MIIKNRHLTSFWHVGLPEEIKALRRNMGGKDVLVDGNLVTSRWPMDLPLFMSETMKKFASLSL